MKRLIEGTSIIPGFKLLRQERTTIRNLKNQNIHPYINPFHNSAMGHMGNIFAGVPPDLLHLFCAGLMKSLVQWVMIIVQCICKYPKGLIILII